MNIDDFAFLWQKTDFITVVAIWIIVWYQLKPIKSDVEKTKSDITKIQSDIQDIDRRLCRIEGAIATKDCCMLKDERKLEKAE